MLRSSTRASPLLGTPRVLDSNHEVQPRFQHSTILSRPIYTATEKGHISWPTSPQPTFSTHLESLQTREAWLFRVLPSCRTMDGDPAVEPEIDSFSRVLPLPYRVAIIVVFGIWAWGVNLHYLHLVKIVLESPVPDCLKTHALT